MTEAEKQMPELGSPQAAVITFVSLAAVAMGQDERKLAYYLDCYYQLRRAYEESQEAEPATAASDPAEAKRAEELALKMRVRDGLLNARKKGIALCTISEASGQTVSDAQILSILEGRYLGISVYRKLDKALKTLDT